jgi:hypothetical protein
MPTTRSNASTTHADTVITPAQTGQETPAMQGGRTSPARPAGGMPQPTTQPSDEGSQPEALATPQEPAATQPFTTWVQRQAQRFDTTQRPHTCTHTQVPCTGTSKHHHAGKDGCARAGRARQQSSGAHSLGAAHTARWLCLCRQQGWARPAPVRKPRAGTSQSGATTSCQATTWPTCQLLLLFQHKLRSPRQQRRVGMACGDCL